MGWTRRLCAGSAAAGAYLRPANYTPFPDYLGARYGGKLPRLAGVFCAIL